MITYNYETSFVLDNKKHISDWIEKIILQYDFRLGEINYIFCDDDYLHALNVQFLQHDTLTDIISFDNTLGGVIAGDIFISIDRIKENAKIFDVSFNEELHRVIIHGVLHFLGIEDKTSSQKEYMRSKENEFLSQLII